MLTMAGTARILVLGRPRTNLADSMRNDSLALRTAKTLVESYSREDGVIEEHKQAMDCRDCETYLQLGIDAFDWLIRADQIARKAIFSGSTAIDPDQVEAEIGRLCRTWLDSGDRANAWIALQQSRGFAVENLDRFRECHAEMRAIVDSQGTKDETLPEAMAALRDQAIEEQPAQSIRLTRPPRLIG
jgi:hypothetical protein